jgi:hypothetical protein
MITAILIILVLSQVISIALIFIIGKNQETNYNILSKHHHSMWDDLIDIRRGANKR